MSKYQGPAFLSEVRLVLLAGLSTATSTAITTADSILSAFGKLQAQITLRAPLASPPFTGTIGGTADFSGVTSLAAGSTARTLSARFSDVINIKDCGGKGDGVTDNTAAFNTALTLGDVYIPSGTYRFASQPNAITVARSIYGAGRTATTILIDYAAGDFLRMGAAGSVPSFATIQGLCISSNVVRTSGASIRVLPTHHAVIRDIAIQPGGAGTLKHFNGIQIDGGTDQFGCFVEDFEISLTQGFGIGLRSIPQDVWIRNGIIGNAGGAGLDLSSGSGVYLTQIDVITSAYGISVSPGAGDNVVGLFCTEVLGDTSTSNNWHFGGTGNVSNVHLTNCWASASSAGTGFFINNPNLNGLTLVNSTSQANHVHGVEIAQGKNVTITGGCQIGMNSAGGSLVGNEIQVDSGVSHVIISNNAVGHVGFYALNGFTSYAAYGINVASGAGDYITITGNKIDVGVNAPGLFQATGSNSSVCDNSGWKTTFTAVQKVSAGQQSVTFAHNLAVADATKINVMITPLVDPAGAGVNRYWANGPTVGIGGTVKVWTDVATSGDFWFTFRCSAFE